MKLDPGMHIVMHLVFFGKIGVTTTKPLQGYAENQQPTIVIAVERTITLPNGQHLSQGCYPKRTGLYPFNSAPPVPLSEKGYQINPLS
jgi:hypothetical protein